MKLSPEEMFEYCLAKTGLAGTQSFTDDDIRRLLSVRDTRSNNNVQSPTDSDLGLLLRIKRQNVAKHHRNALAVIARDPSFLKLLDKSDI